MTEEDPRSFFKEYVSTRQPAVLRYAQGDRCNSARSIISKFWSNDELRARSGEDKIRCEIRDDITTEGMKSMIPLIVGLIYS